MSKQISFTLRQNNAYNLFIMLLTIFSLLLMGLLLLPLDRDTLRLLHLYDILMCLVFLFDFLINLKSAEKKSDYFITERGWLDLLGSIPSLGLVFKYSGIFRLARLSRIERIFRHQREQGADNIVADVIRHRHQYVGYTTILLTIIVLTSASVLILQFESRSPDSSIQTGWDALWFSVVTITTTGYGDFSPMTFLGKVTAMFIMVVGIGIIAVLASLMSRLLIGSPADRAKEIDLDREADRKIEQELALIKREIGEIRQWLEKIVMDVDEP